MTILVTRIFYIAKTDKQTTSLDSTVVSIPHCGCGDPSSILGLDKRILLTLRKETTGVNRSNLN